MDRVCSKGNASASTKPGAWKYAVIAGCWTSLPVAWIVGLDFVHPAANWLFAAFAVHLPLALLWREAGARVLGRVAIAVSTCYLPVILLWNMSPITTELIAEGDAGQGWRIRLYSTGWALDSDRHCHAEYVMAGCLRYSKPIGLPREETLVVLWNGEAVRLTATS